MTLLGLELVGSGEENIREWILGEGGLKKHGVSSENKIKRKARPGCACVADSLLVAGTVMSSVSEARNLSVWFDSKFQLMRYVSQPFTISSI